VIDRTPIATRATLPGPVSSRWGLTAWLATVVLVAFAHLSCAGESSHPTGGAGAVSGGAGHFGSAGSAGASLAGTAAAVGGTSGQGGAGLSAGATSADAGYAGAPLGGIGGEATDTAGHGGGVLAAGRNSDGGAGLSAAGSGGAVGGASAGAGGNSSGGVAGSSGAAAGGCPPTSPSGEGCDPGLVCIYEYCNENGQDYGRVMAACQGNSRWSGGLVATCGGVTHCLDERGVETCAAGEVCLIRGGNVECIPNTCGPGLVSCECLGHCDCMFTGNTGGVTLLCP
jgi:hypothetical protein